MYRLILLLILLLTGWALPNDPAGSKIFPGSPGGDLHILPVGPPKYFKRNNAPLPLTRVGEYAPPKNRGKMMEMELDGSRGYIATTKGLVLLDLSDSAHPQELRFHFGPQWEGIVAMELLDDGKLLLLQRKKRVRLGYRGESYDATPETIKILDFTDPKRPREEARNTLFLVDQEQTCSRHRKQRLLPEELGRKLGKIVLNDGYFGFGVSMVARGSDIYILRDVGLTHLAQGVEYRQDAGSTLPLRTIRVKRHIYLPALLRPGSEVISCSAGFCSREGGCLLYFGYSGGYLAVGPNVVATPYALFDRDLERLEHWQRIRNEGDHTPAGVLLYAGDRNYLFEVRKEKNGCLLELFGVDRTGRVEPLYSFSPKICSQNVKHSTLRLENLGKYLLLAGCTEGGRCMMELLEIDERMRPKSRLAHSVGSHWVQDGAAQEGKLYLLRDDTLLIYRLDD